MGAISSHRNVFYMVKPVEGKEKSFGIFFGILSQRWDKIPKTILSQRKTKKAKERNFLNVGRMDAVVRGVECAHDGASNGGVKSCVRVDLVGVSKFEV